jgi:hypothetical protein
VDNYLALRGSFLANKRDLGLEVVEISDVLLESLVRNSSPVNFIIILVVGQVRIFDIAQLTLHDQILLVDEFGQHLVDSEFLMSGRLKSHFMALNELSRDRCRSSRF